MRKILATTLILIFAPLMFLQVASAQLLNSATDDITTQVATQASLGQMDVGSLIARIIQILLGFLGVIFLVLMILGGFRWMTAAGNEESIKHAQGTIKTAIIGLIIILAAYSITYFVFRYLPFSGGKASTTQTGG